MSKTILHKRGLKENLPVLKESELAFTRDTEEVFIGTKDKKLKLLTEHDSQKTIVFVLSGDVITGVADPSIVLSHDVAISNIKAYIMNPLSLDLLFDIEYSNDFNEWNKLTAEPIKIEQNAHSNSEMVINAKSLPAETALRINVVQSSSEARNLTININITKGVD